MIILGINFYHSDSSATLVVNGKIKAAAEEERFARIKHYDGFPVSSIDYCLKKSKLNINDIDIIAVNSNFYHNFTNKIQFLIKNLFNFNLIFNKLKKIKTIKSIEEYIYIYFGRTKKIKIIYVPHHLSHSASVALVSGKKNGLSISIDGSGDFSSSEIYNFSKKSFKLIFKQVFPHSLGIFYQAVTQFLGFLDYGDEYKVMGLAAYGKSKYLNELKKLILYKNGQYKLNLKYFSHHKFNEENFTYNCLYSDLLTKILGKPRIPNSVITQKHKDIAASLQILFEEIIINYLNYYVKKYKPKNLFLSGGCFFNSLCNMKVLEKVNIDNVFLSINPGDAGGSLGAAVYASAKYDSKFVNKKFRNSYLGYVDNTNEITKIINSNYFNGQKLKYTKFSNFNLLCKRVAFKIAQNKVIAWHQGAAEFGPRALGNRSILANPSNNRIKLIINKKIKIREIFRPFAPSVLDKFAKNFFVLKKNYEYFYMNATTKTKKNFIKKIPAVLNIDNTARIHIVKKKLNYRYYRLLESFYKLTKLPILLNTSLNINEPICNSINDSLTTFIQSDIDYLVVGNYLIKKANA